MPAACTALQTSDLGRFAPFPVSLPQGDLLDKVGNGWAEGGGAEDQGRGNFVNKHKSSHTAILPASSQGHRTGVGGSEFCFLRAPTDYASAPLGICHI